MAITFDITDEVSPALKRLPPVLHSEVAPAIGAAVVQLFQSHFAALPPNSKGWPTTNFWQRAAKATNYNVLGADVEVSVNQQGIRQRVFGGEIHPTPGHNWLTIPARAEAYGQRAREFSNLEPAFFKTSHGFFAALVEAQSQSVSFGRKRKDDSRKVKAGAESGGGVMFWLVKSVTQKGDPTVVPSDEQIVSTAVATVAGIAKRAIARGGKA